MALSSLTIRSASIKSAAHPSRAGHSGGARQQALSSLGIYQPHIPVFIFRMQDRDAIPSNEASVAGWNTCSGERVRLFHRTYRVSVLAGHQHHRALTCSSYRHVFAQQRAVSQLMRVSPSRVLKKYFMCYLRFRRIRMGGGKNDFFITATIRELPA